MLSKKLLAIVFAGVMATPASAALIDAPLPSNAFITLNGFDWAWGGNCSQNSGTGCDTLEFSFQASQGWRIATANDMALAPVATDFLFDGANVDFNGTDPVSGASFNFTNAAYTNAGLDGACASAYFTLGDGLNSCDWGNGSGQNQNTVGWFNQNGETNFFAEVLFIRDANPVPIPGAAVFLASGLAGFFGLKRRRKAA